MSGMATEGIVFLYCSYVCNCAKNPNFRKLQIFISQTTDFHFTNYRFSFCKLQIFISQTIDFHFANYRFRFVPFRFVSLHFVSQTTVSQKISDALKLFSLERDDFFLVVFLKYRDKLSTTTTKKLDKLEILCGTKYLRVLICTIFAIFPAIRKNKFPQKNY